MKWTITHSLGDIVVCGPGALEIVLRDFSPARVLPDCPLLAELLAPLEQRVWEVELEPGTGLHLQLISTKDPRQPEYPEQHWLRVGNYVSMEVPADFAEQLHAMRHEVTA